MKMGTRRRDSVGARGGGRGGSRAAVVTGPATSRSSSSANRILIVRLSSMGDVIHSLPLAGMRDRAGAEVGWVVEPEFAGLLEGNSDVAKVFVADTKVWRKRPLAPETLRETKSLRAALRGFAPRAVDRRAGTLEVGRRRPSRGSSGGRIREGLPPGARLGACSAPFPVAPAGGRGARRGPEPRAPGSGREFRSAVRAPDARYLADRPHAEADAFSSPPSSVRWYFFTPERDGPRRRGRGTLRARGAGTAFASAASLRSCPGGPGDERRGRASPVSAPQAPRRCRASTSRVWRA
jgi:hypothetical protein